MNPKPAPHVAPDPRIVEAAAAWLAQHDAGLDREQKLAFTTWLEADPRHAAAWQEMGVAWAAFDEPRYLNLADAMIVELAARQRRRRWRVVQAGVAAALLATAAAVVLLVRPASPPAGQSPTMLRAGHNVMEDGSHIDLNTGAEVAVSYTPARREVQLLRGEALFTVAKNANRPFVVSAAGVEVRAVGTVFAVALQNTNVDLLVTEGRVIVRRGRNSALVLASAGERLLIPTDPGSTWPPPVLAQTEEQMDQRLGWLNLSLDLRNLSLRESIKLFNARNVLQLSIADPALGTMRMDGIFLVTNVEGFLRLLESNYQVKAERVGDNRVILSHQ